MYSSSLSLTSPLDGLGGQRHALTALPPGKPGAHCMWASGPVPTGIPSPDRPASSKSLYRLSYPGPGRPKQMGRAVSTPNLTVTFLITYFHFQYLIIF